MISRKPRRRRAPDPFAFYLGLLVIVLSLAALATWAADSIAATHAAWKHAHQ